MTLTADHLYSLLPSIYRIRDAEGSGELRALIEVLADQGKIVEEDIANLYENWFIETCDEWVVPYIGDLLGVRNLYEVDRLHSVDSGVVFSRRARVANTLAYRRRKGTATMLEQLARDTTGWNARAVEFFTRLGWTQNMNHLRMDGHSTVDLRGSDELELLETPFGTSGHTVDVRQIASERGQYNIPNVGIFLWRLSSYYIQHVEARPAASPSDGRYRFNPLGLDQHLFNRPQTETEITSLAGEVNVPGPLRRAPLYHELEALRLSLAAGGTGQELWFGDMPPFRLFVRENPGDDLVEIPPEQILICNLQEAPDSEPPLPEVWRRPPETKDYTPEGSAVPVAMPIRVAVDPVLGRIAFRSDAIPDRVEVSYSYGFSGDVGGGPYNRKASVENILQGREVAWQAGVAKEIPVGATAFFQTISEAVEAWNTWSAANPGKTGVIAITDNATYREDVTGVNRVEIPEGSLLTIVCADWPAEIQSDGTPVWNRGELEPDENRAHLLGSLSVKGTALNTSLSPGDLVVDGLLIEGNVRVLSGNLGRLRLAHCTVVPAAGNLKVTTNNESLRVELYRSMCGTVRFQTAVPTLLVEESILDGGNLSAVIAHQTAIDIRRSTIFEGVKGLRIDADSSIITGRMVAERRQIGCVRFSYIAKNSVVPRRYRCQPGLAFVDRARELDLNSASDLSAREREAIRLRVTPLFTSEQFGDPGYAQLSRSAAEELRMGGENGAEMGVFNFLLSVQREANLRESLSDFLRFGLETGVFFVT